MACDFQLLVNVQNEVCVFVLFFNLQIYTNFHLLYRVVNLQATEVSSSGEEGALEGGLYGSPPHLKSLPKASPPQPAGLKSPGASPLRVGNPIPVEVNICALE